MPNNVDAYAAAVEQSIVKSSPGGYLTPDDGTIIYDPPLRGLNVAGAGFVDVVLSDGSTMAPYLAAGVFHGMSVLKLLSANTTATTITGAR